MNLFWFSYSFISVNKDRAGLSSVNILYNEKWSLPPSVEQVSNRVCSQLQKPKIQTNRRLQPFIFFIADKKIGIFYLKSRRKISINATRRFPSYNSLGFLWWSLIFFGLQISYFLFFITIPTRLQKKEVDKLHSFLEYSLAYLSSREIIWLLPARLFWKRLKSTFCPCSAVVLSLNIFIRP